MQICPLADIADSLAVGFGVAAAILLVGGSLLLRWQRARLRFALAKIALEKGMPLFPGAPPLWLMSLRQGILLIALGIGLLAIGAFAVADAKKVPDPPESLMNKVQPMPGPMPGEGPMFRGPGRGPDEGPGGGPGFAPRDGRGPQGPAAAPPRPAPIPALERWHRAQEQRTLGMAAAGVGVILLLLGIVRTVFAKVERKFSPAAQEQ
jgi:hypothetical protein